MKLKKHCDELVGQGKIGESGETAKIYWVNQESIPLPSEEESKAETGELARLEEEATALSVTKVAALHASLSALIHEPSQEDFPRVLREHQAWIESAEATLETHRLACAEAGTSSSLDLATLRKQLAFYEKQEKQRRNPVLDFLKDVATQMGKDWRALGEEIGLTM